MSIQPPPRRRLGCGIALGAAGVLLLIIIIVAVASGGTSSSPAPETAPSVDASTEQPTNRNPKPSPTPSGPATSIEQGTYVVGSDIAAGTYKTTGPDGSNVVGCYWSRLKDTTGNFGTIIANNISKGPTTVTISKSDGAFETSGCNTWQKVG